ncbi:hypothetical protein GC175_03305 [bacterium]|nr:hypothetical protein [bacterium]
MSHDPPNTHPPPQRESFIVRTWRAADTSSEEWRCHLIHVGTGRHLPCDQLDHLAQVIGRWLQEESASSVDGLR